ncbi:MAG: hypothetical protein U5K81_07120 [Trueperaceae bacterium]|nr:hypothetical protein [Trueperaceae bacterium]
MRRAKAFAEAALWRHGVPGTVHLVLVPDLDPGRTAQSGATLDALTAAQTGQALSDVQNDVDARRPLGTRCRVAWARYKPLRIGARVVVFAEEDAAAVGTRLAGRLNELLDPLRARDFGEPMRASDVYDVLLREPGVRYADHVHLEVDSAPDAEVHAVATDRFQPGTWYAGAGGATYRTLDDADGWERVRVDEAFTVAGVFPHPSRPGMVAVLLQDEPQGRWRLAVSDDCGESWRSNEAELSFRVYDVAWLDRTGDAVLLLATRQGLFQLPLSDTSLTPVQVPVDPDKTDRGFYAVAVSAGVRGRTFVAVAADQLGGVFLSDQGGGDGTFRAFGLDGTDVRVLQMHADGPRLYLWAGAAAVGGEPGDGCFRGASCASVRTPLPSGGSTARAGAAAVATNWPSPAGRCTPPRTQGARCGWTPAAGRPPGRGRPWTAGCRSATPNGCCTRSAPSPRGAATPPACWRAGTPASTAARIRAGPGSPCRDEPTRTR